MVSSDPRLRGDDMTSTPDRRPKITLTEVASAAGVSLPTASKALNSHPGVALETRHRVQVAVDQLGYVPRVSLNRAAPRIVEVMVDQLTTNYAMEVLRGATLAAEEVGVSIVISRFNREAPKSGRLQPSNWAARLAAAGRCGAIILTAHLRSEDQKRLTLEHLPVVLIDPLELGATEVPSVGSTNWAGGYDATEHLTRLGHRRIGSIGGRRASVAARARMHGFRAACATAEISVDEAFVVFTDFTYESGLAVADKWLSQEDPPTAIIAASDAQAMGVMEAARRHALVIPDDLSVVGYDDTYIASWATPPLTCVRQPLQEMGKVALRTLLGMVDGEELTSKHVELATELVVRGSTGPPRHSSPGRHDR